MNTILSRGEKRSSVAQRAFTLLEMLVVIGVIAILAGLSLPAIQSARESARRLRCLANLGQLSRSVHLFEVANGGFPMEGFLTGPLFNGKLGANGKPIYAVYPYICKLLPHLEQASLFNSINFNTLNNHATAQLTRIDTFVCPSEVRFDAIVGYAPLSYRGNYGLLEWSNPSSEPPAPTQLTKLGAFHPASSYDDRVTPISFIRDGLSATLLFSEKPIGSGADGEYRAFRDWTQVDDSDPHESTADLWLGTCSRLASPKMRLDAGASWLMSGIPYTLFSPNDAPNGRVPDCGSLTWRGIGVFTARSYHPGGVNAAMCDGSARWFTSSTNRAVWRAIGTANGDESVEF